MGFRVEIQDPGLTCKNPTKTDDPEGHRETCMTFYNPKNFQFAEQTAKLGRLLSPSRPSFSSNMLEGAGLCFSTRVALTKRPSREIVLAV